jgi:hypothetical protein
MSKSPTFSPESLRKARVTANDRANAQAAAASRTADAPAPVKARPTPARKADGRQRTSLPARPARPARPRDGKTPTETIAASNVGVEREGRSSAERHSEERVTGSGSIER